MSADFLNEGDGATVLGGHLVDRAPQWSPLIGGLLGHGTEDVRAEASVVSGRMRTIVAAEYALI